MEDTIQKHLTKYMEEKRQSLNVTLQTYYSETCLKQNLGIIETFLKQETPTVPRIQTSSTSMKWNVPATGKNLAPCGSVTGKFCYRQVPQSSNTLKVQVCLNHEQNRCN
jgi:hypothetical protein